MKQTFHRYALYHDVFQPNGYLYHIGRDLFPLKQNQDIPLSKETVMKFKGLFVDGFGDFSTSIRDLRGAHDGWKRYRIRDDFLWLTGA